MLLVDIDGVISLWGFDPNVRPAGTFVSVEGIVHFLSERAARHLHELAADFDLAWCSGWEERANEHLPHVLGLGPFPFVALDVAAGDGSTAPPGSGSTGPPARTRAGTSTPGHWKLAAIDRFAGPERPLAWIDDAFNDACLAWAERRAGPTLLVRTDPADGLVGGHVDDLRAFARSLPPATAAQPFDLP